MLAARVLVVGLALGSAAGCGGGTQAFALSGRDNDPAELRAALARLAGPRENRPVGADGRPAVYVATGIDRADMADRIARFDLDGATERWDVEAAPASKVVVGADFVAYVDRDGGLVGLDSATGARRFAAPLGAGTVRGLAADARRVFAVVARDASSFEVLAFDGATGAPLWSRPAPAELGAPAARDGLVLLPYRRQWVVLLDAVSGEPIARLRSDDEEVAFVRATPTAMYFGSKSGAFLLDERAVAGTRAGATYGRASVPGEFIRSFYHFDAFDPVQVGYSAYDRNRLLWRGGAGQGGAFAFTDGVIVVHSYKFFFGFEAESGNLSWAVALDGGDAVASSHLGSVIGFVTAAGTIGALAPATGNRGAALDLDLSDRVVLGATFDADGWSPSLDARADTAAALAGIVRDRDARFTDVKLFAVTALAGLDDAAVTGELLAIALAKRTPPRVYDKTVQMLIARKDPAGLPVLLDALETRHDYLEGTRPRAVDVIARAIAAMGNLGGRDGVSAEVRARVVERLSAHLFDPQTEPVAIEAIVGALGQVGDPAALTRLRTYLLTYRADPGFARQMAAVGATIDALVASGGGAERAAVAFVAEDAATEPGIAEYATRALREPPRPRQDAAP